MLNSEPAFQEHTYSSITSEVEIQVRPFYMPERSDPKAGVFFYGYQVTITNHGSSPLVLQDRHWIIRDGNGRQDHVKGKGVIGQNPTIEAGKTYQYSSFCPLSTPTGNMRGTYSLKNEQGHTVTVKIPLFFFRRPETFH